MEERRGELGDLISAQLTRAQDLAEAEAYATAAANPEWWERAYAGGPPVGPAKLPRPLYAPGNPSNKPASPKGSDVEAYKRALWRGGRWEGPATRFDRTYSKGFALGVGPNVIDSGVAGFQRQMSVQATGQLGDETYQAIRYARVPEGAGFPHAGEPLLDQYAVDLLFGFTMPPPANADEVRRHIADYCARCIAKTAYWHYEQYRPMRSLGDSPEGGGYSDCSEHSTAAYYWAKQQTSVAVPDPNHRGYDGYGYTGTLIENPSVSGSYQIGDLAIYGNSASETEHVCTCYVAGNSTVSKWCSHGSEEAPYSVHLHYRGDLLRVVRPGVMP